MNFNPRLLAVGGSMPRWLRVLMLVFLFKGMVLALALKPWSGEDEPSHFGYIEHLLQRNTWYAFEANHSSIEARMAQRWWDIAEDKQSVVHLFESGEFSRYRGYLSSHQNATAYQPPLYYWLMARASDMLPDLSPFGYLYLWRMANVVLGVLYIFVTHQLSTMVFDTDANRLVMVSFVTWLPLLSLLSATVTVQVSVFLVYGLLIWSLMRAHGNPILGHGTSLVLVALGLLLQQALWAAPVVWLVVLAFDTRALRVAKKQAVVLVGLFSLSLVLTAPQLWRRHLETEYVYTGGSEIPKRLDIWHYLPDQWERIQDEMIGSFWDQNRSFIPYYASARILKAVTVLSVVAFFGLVLGIQRQRSEKSFTELERRWLLIGAILTVIFVVGHLWFDYYQLVHSGQEYIKARYWYPLLPFLAWGFIYGMRQVAKERFWYSSVMVGFVGLLIWLQVSALSWLLLHT